MNIINRVLGLIAPFFIIGVLFYFMHWPQGKLYLSVGGIGTIVILLIRFGFLKSRPFIDIIKHFGIILLVGGVLLSVNDILPLEYRRWLTLLIGSLGTLGIIYAYYNAFFNDKEKASSFKHPFILVSIALALIGNLLNIMHIDGANILLILGFSGLCIWSLYIYGFKGGIID